MKQDYIRIMAKAVAAYSDRQIDDYIGRIRTEKLTEHGFPRLTANIGILLAHGIRKDLLPRFIEMMDLCCDQMPNRMLGVNDSHVGNDFTVKEISFCLMEIEAAKLVPAEKIAGWKDRLRTIDPLKTYDCVAYAHNIRIGNWAAYAAASDFLRGYIGLGDPTDFINRQLPSQLLSFEENGMYRDPDEPMLYDLATRTQLAVMLHFGYDGVFAQEIDANLRKAGLLTLKMQSVTGEIAFGGRSNQFLFNEAYLAAICEFEASRYQKEGNTALAGQFKDAAALATQAIFDWLGGQRHVKNCYPQESGYGCEGYGYFNKYMTTLASFIYLAYLFADDAIVPVPCPARGDTHYAFTGPYFHKFFAFAGGYMLEFDTRADAHYDATGLGRVHRSGVPGPLALSVPFTVHPVYDIEGTNPGALSMCAGTVRNGQTVLACEGSGIISIQVDTEEADKIAFTVTELAAGKRIASHYTVSAAGVDITAEGEGEIVYALPAFRFNGAEKTAFTQDERSFSVSFYGHTYTARTDGTMVNTGIDYRNRNGSYTRCEAHGKDRVNIRLTVE